MGFKLLILNSFIKLAYFHSVNLFCLLLGTSLFNCLYLSLLYRHFFSIGLRIIREEPEEDAKQDDG
jgi:uncharacterized protein (DUF2062 family)